jgi:DNA-binding NarL/FixJ family response regulator
VPTTLETPSRVLIVDDSVRFRATLREALAKQPDIEVVGEAGSAKEAFALIDETNPSLILLDIRMPETSGIAAAKILKKNRPDIKIILLSGYDYDQYVRAASRAGIEGYVLKDASFDIIAHGIRVVAGGGSMLSPTVAIKAFRSDAAQVAN